MSSLNSGLLSQDLSLWVGFIFSLLIFSTLFGDHRLAKLAQYLLVGVSLGYVGALVVQHVLRPRLFVPLLTAPLATPALWLSLLCGLLFFMAGLERILHASTPMDTPATWRRWLRTLGSIPAALLVGTSLSVVLIGIWQGTLWPQLWATARSGLNWHGAVGAALVSVLVIVLTTASLLHWTLPINELTVGQTAWVRYLLRGWSGLGKRVLWLATGVVFARLFAGYLSLLIARIQFFLFSLDNTMLWLWAERIWRGISGT